MVHIGRVFVFVFFTSVLFCCGFAVGFHTACVQQCVYWLLFLNFQLQKRVRIVACIEYVLVFLPVSLCVTCTSKLDYLSSSLRGLSRERRFKAILKQTRSFVFRYTCWWSRRTHSTLSVLFSCCPTNYYNTHIQDLSSSPVLHCVCVCVCVCVNVCVCVCVLIACHLFSFPFERLFDLSYSDIWQLL